VQVGPRHSSGRPRFAKKVSPGGARPDADRDAGEVRKERKQTGAVIDDHGLTQEIQIRREYDLPGVGRAYWRPGGGWKIDSLMAAAWLAIEHRQAAETARCRARYGRRKGSAPESVRH